MVEFKALSERILELEDERRSLLRAADEDGVESQPVKGSRGAAEKDFNRRWREIEKQIEKCKKMKQKNATRRSRMNSALGAKIRRLEEATDEENSDRGGIEK